MIMRTAVILAGGKSRRMGKDKLELEYCGKTLLEAAVERFSKCFDKVYVSVADPEKYPYIKAERIEDIYKDCGPMAGLHAALKKTDDEGVFLVAADLPFSDPGAAKRIIDLVGTNDAALMLDKEGRYEPLFAYYKKTLLPEVEALLDAGEYKMIKIIESITVKKVTINELEGFWNDKILVNINRIEDYQKLAE